MWPKTFNDTVAVLLLGMIGLFWLLDGWGKIQLNDTVAGGLIVAFTLVVQHYFRKAPPPNGNGGGKPPPIV